MDEELEKWARVGVEGHFTGDRPWKSIEELVEPHLEALVGARHRHEVCAMGTLTANVHTLFSHFYRPAGDRDCIMIEGKSFPSDFYAVQSVLERAGAPKDRLLELVPRPGETLLRMNDILRRIDQEGDRIAIVWIGSVQYYTGQAFDLEAIAAACHRKGCLFGVDLAHAAGNLELKLHDWGVDFAALCSYKYLNSGPGSIAGIFVHDRHSSRRPTQAGWWGHNRDSRFEMSHDFDPLPGALGLQLSNPGVLSMVSLLASLEIFTEATMPALRAKSVLLTGYLEALLDAELEGKVEIITPRDVDERGCQLSLRFDPAQLTRVMDALAQRGIIADSRKPDVIRIAPTPLYNTFKDVHKFVMVLKDVLQ